VSSPHLTPDSTAPDRISLPFPPSPLQYVERLSAALGRPVWFKREDLQPVRSYKVRGAWHFLQQALIDGPVHELVAASAGNHAQGLAWCAARLHFPVTVVLPARTPRQKRQRIAAIGGDLVHLELVAGVFDDAARYASELARDRGALLVPPFDHPAIIAGQGTVAAEIIQQLGPQHGSRAVLVVPVGGGGLAAGCRLRLAADPARTWTLVAAEAAGSASLHAAWDAGTPVELDELDPFVDGAAVKRIGAHPWTHLAQTNGVVPIQGAVVDEGAVATAMLELYEADGIITEPAGALAVAALLGHAQHFPDAESPVVCVISGGNNDVSRYGEVLERSLVHRGLRHYFLVEFPQQPGALRRFLDEILGPEDDIILFEYVKKANRETGPALVGIEIGQPAALPGLLRRLADGPVQATVIPPGSALARLLT
jgi:threonine dehydratase